MLHVIDRPPFDEFTFKLFTELFRNRREFGLQDAEFIYTWTGHMALPDGKVTNKDIFEPGSLRKVPESITDLYFWKFGYNQILGEGKYLNQVDDLYQHFLETMKDHVDFSTELYDQFCNSYNLIHKSFQDKKQIEYKIDQIISSAKTIVMFVKDHFRVSLEKSWINFKPELSEYFSNMFEYYSDKKFVLVTSLENLDKEIKSDNCVIIPMGGDITNQMNRFNEYSVVDQKVKSEKQCISLNRGLRNHRTYLVSLLFGKGLDKFTNITYLGLGESTKSLVDILQYDTSSDPMFPIVDSGFSRFLSTTKQFDHVDIYRETGPNDNIFNFNNSLRSKYRSSFLEFVSETNYNEWSFNITEKFSHSVFGLNLPIIVSSPGYVEFLRNVGFDMFDDIIDHSYDLETDKLKRLHQMVLNNQEILSSDLSGSFPGYKSRLYSNCDVLINKLPDYYITRFWERLKQI